MSRFPHATFAWRRLKLILAEYLVLSILKKEDRGGDHDLALVGAADSIEKFRDQFYALKDRPL